MKTINNLIIYTFSGVLIIGLLMAASLGLAGEQGSGKVVKQERKVSPFTSLDISGAYNVYLSQGATQSVILEADDNMIDKIITEVDGGTLKIKNKSTLRKAKSLKVYITATKIEEIDLSGAVDLFSQTKLSGSHIGINVSGASDSKLEIEYDKLDLICKGGSDMELWGSATEVKMDVSGAVDLHAFSLVTDKFLLTMSGAGTAEINVKNELSADISGAATIRYKGTPAKLTEDISGAGSVRKAE